tara:strand:+ start:429 stop:863 length:435 start_codon:yes stop_codon:yes gene_type:complete
MPYASTDVVRRTLTGSVHGTGIKVDSTSTGLEIHTHDATLNQSLFDEVHLWAHNSSGSAVTLTLQWGGTSNPDNLIVISLQANTFLKIVDGLHIQGNLDIKAIASTANVVMVYGYALSHVQSQPLTGDAYVEDDQVYYNGYVRR